MSQVAPIGCSTKGWRDPYYVNERVQRVLDRDPELRRLLQKKLSEHGRKLPKMLGRGRPVHTIVWKAVTHYQGGGFNIRAIVITTECLPDYRLMTHITSERGKFDR